jgi:hypothetical protein
MKKMNPTIEIRKMSSKIDLKIIKKLKSLPDQKKLTAGEKSVSIRTNVFSVTLWLLLLLLYFFFLTIILTVTLTWMAALLKKWDVLDLANKRNAKFL